MKISSFQKRRGYLIIGGIGLVISAVYLGMSLQFSFGRMNQPGAGVFPVFVAFVMTLASLTTVFEGWRMEKVLQAQFPVGNDRKRLLSVVTLLFGYILILPWLGQAIVSMIFCILLLRILSDIVWPRIIIYSIVISITLYLIFVIWLEVPMPQGLLFS